MLPQILISILAVAIVVGIAIFGFTSGNYMIHALLLIAPLVLMLSGNIGLVFTLILGLRYSDLILPGLPQGLNLLDVMIMFLIALVLGRYSITKKRIAQWQLSHYALFGFSLVLLLVIALRGIGIRFFGSSEWGGFVYVKLFISIGFYMLCNRVEITEKQMKNGLILMILMSAIPASAQALFYLSGGTVYFQYMFLEAYSSGLLSTLDAMQSDSGTARFYFTGMASAFVICAMAFFPLHRRTRMLFVLFLLTGFFITLLSGFRGATVGIAVTTMLYMILYYPERRTLIMAGGVAVFAGSLLVLTPFIPDLPAGIQRALSWVPWYEIPIHVKVDASVSTEWRFEVWKEAWSHLPNYLLLGRGLTFNASQVEAALALRDTISWAYISHNYHNGPLSILITTGLPGSLLFVAFSIAVCAEALRGFKAIRRHARSPFLFRVYTVFMAFLLYAVASFYILYGDMKSSLPNILFLAAFLQVLRSNFLGDPSPAPAPPPPTPRPLSPFGRLPTPRSATMIRP